MSLRRLKLAVRRLMPCVPYLALAAIFTVSRIVCRTRLGVRFDSSPITFFVQYIDPWFVQHDFARSLLYLHHQAPFQNLLTGGCVRLFGTDAGIRVLDGIYVALGFTIAIGMLHVMIRLRTPVALAVLAAALYTVSPAAVLYENQLFYHEPVAALLVVSVVALLRYYRVGTFVAALTFFGAIATVALFRSTFGPVFLATALALVLLRPPWPDRPTVVARKRAFYAALLPFFVLVLNSAKPTLLIGHAYGTPLFWGNLAKKTFDAVPPVERQRLLDAGLVSLAVTLDPLATDLPDFGSARVPHEPTGIPLLDLERTPDGHRNMHALEYILIAEKFSRADAHYLIKHYPDAYGRAVQHALADWYGKLPTDDYFIGLRNVGRVGELDEATRDLLGRRPDGRLSALMIGLPLAVLYGGLRLAKRRARLESQRASTAATAYMLLCIGYVTLVSVLVSYGDFYRYRFDVDPLHVVLFTLLVGDVARSARRVLASAATEVRRGLGHTRTGVSSS